MITRIERKTEYVYRGSFHIMDPAWGHMVVKMSGHPPWPAQVILNGHEYVAVAAQGEGIGFVEEGNCFTGIADPRGLARVADALSQHAAIGRLGQACDRWIYTACLCFGLDLDDQARSGFRDGYSVYQAEYSRNLLFRSGGQMEDLFNRVLDRTRSRLDIPVLRTTFGLKRSARKIVRGVIDKYVSAGHRGWPGPGEVKISMLEERRGEVEDLAGGSPAGPEAADPGGGLVLPEEVLAALAGQLAARARAGEPVTLTGPGGLLTWVIGQVLAAGLAAELDGHLQDGEGEPNRRNGSSLKTLNTEVGPVQVAVPRGRSVDSGS